jgi:DHA1 family bicyclomycin/chloramphenicol resistance-like MFS transporter
MIPNGGALASAAVPEHPGTGSAVQGFVQWVAAGTIAPIAGLGGEHTAVPMAALMTTGAILSMLGLLVLARPRATQTVAATMAGPDAADPSVSTIRVVRSR